MPSVVLLVGWYQTVGVGQSVRIVGKDNVYHIYNVTKSVLLLTSVTLVDPVLYVRMECVNQEVVVMTLVTLQLAVLIHALIVLVVSVDTFKAAKASVIHFVIPSIVHVMPGNEMPPKLFATIPRSQHVISFS